MPQNSEFLTLPPRRLTRPSTSALPRSPWSAKATVASPSTSASTATCDRSVGRNCTRFRKQDISTGRVVPVTPAHRQWQPGRRATAAAVCRSSFRGRQGALTSKPLALLACAETGARQLMWLFGPTTSTKRFHRAESVRLVHDASALQRRRALRLGRGRLAAFARHAAVVEVAAAAAVRWPHQLFCVGCQITFRSAPEVAASHSLGVLSLWHCQLGSEILNLLRTLVHIRSCDTPHLCAALSPAQQATPM